MFNSNKKRKSTPFERGCFPPFFPYIFVLLLQEILE